MKPSVLPYRIVTAQSAEIDGIVQPARVEWHFSDSDEAKRTAILNLLLAEPLWVHIWNGTCTDPARAYVGRVVVAREMRKLAPLAMEIGRHIHHARHTRHAIVEQSTIDEIIAAADNICDRIAAKFDAVAAQYENPAPAGKFATLKNLKRRINDRIAIWSCRRRRFR